jgi:uncharacterized protein (UPF0248 family)
MHAEVIDRILWDPILDTHDFTVGYVDRFSGTQEVNIAAPNLTVKGRARLFVKAIPQARIAYIKYKQRVSAMLVALPTRQLLVRVT